MTHPTLTKIPCVEEDRDIQVVAQIKPEMDGASMLDRFRENPQLANTPVIFMAAKVPVNEATYYKLPGAIGVIAKPFDPMQPAGQVRGVWQAGPQS